MEKVVEKHEENEIVNEDELDPELSDILNDLSEEECAPTEELNDLEEEIDNIEKEKASIIEDVEKAFDDLKYVLESEEFSNQLADSFYLRLFGQKAFDKMKVKQAKKKAKAEARKARKEARKSTFNEKVSDILKTHPKKVGAGIGLVICFMLGVGYGISNR